MERSPALGQTAVRTCQYVTVTVFVAQCYTSAALTVMRCLSVCMSVTFMDSFRTDIFKKFSPDTHTILVFLYQNIMAVFSTGTPPNGEVECRWDRQKSRFWANIWLHCMLWTVPAASAIHLAATDRGEFITLVAGKRPSLLMAETTKCMTRSLNVMQKTTLRSGKSEA